MRHFSSHFPQKISPPKVETIPLCITNFLFKDVCCALGFGHFRTNEVVKECQNLIITKSHTLLKGLDVKTRIWEGVICTKLSIFNHTYISSILDGLQTLDWRCTKHIITCQRTFLEHLFKNKCLYKISCTMNKIDAKRG